MSRLIDAAQVRRIARLARLHLSDDEVRLFSDQLTNILDYVGQIESLDTAGVEPLAHAGGARDPSRDDEPHDGLSLQQALANAPDRCGDCFRVPPVIDPQGGA
jgi:aspartyl-tRNA(Asn)/glutamyl-tRNA(Gln) amidotransferase subunit C